MMFNRYVIEHIDIQFNSVTRVFKFQESDISIGHRSVLEIECESKIW